MNLTRRHALASVPTLAAAPLLLAAAPPSAPSPAPLAAEGPTVKPLPFDAKKLRGLSEKLIVSHHDNNYAAAVKNLVKVREHIAATTKDTPGFVVSGLRERELMFRGSTVLHELYFGNLGGDGKPAGSLVKVLPVDWEARLRATAMSLGGGSGWATLSLSLHTGELLIGWGGNHTQNVPAALPLVVIDMYEHAYGIDFGASASSYVDAVFGNLDWGVIESRYQRALRARSALS